MAVSYSLGLAASVVYLERRGDAVTSETASPPSAPAGPLELLRSRSYVGLLVLGAVVGIVVATVAYFFLKGVAEAQEYLFTSLPDDLGFDGGTGVVAASAPRAGRIGGRSHDPLPAWNRRARSRRGIQALRCSPSGRASGHHHRGLRHARLRGGARARSSAHRDRQRNGRPGGPSGPPGRSANGERGDRGRRQFRGDQHAPRLSAHRGLPAHGGVRARGRDARRRARTGPARRRRGLADLHRAELMDGLRELLACGPRHSDVHDAGRRRVLLGGRDRDRRCRPRKRHPTVGPAAPACCRAQSGVADAGGRNGGRRPGDRLR